MTGWSVGSGSIGSVQFRPQLLAQKIDRHRPTLDVHAPERPAVATRRALHGGADLMNRAAMVAGVAGAGDRPVGADLGAPALAGADQQVACREQDRKSTRLNSSH